MSKGMVLDAYELQRQPHMPVTDETVVNLAWNSLENELKCPVCLSIINETMTTKECMHRFCADCISKSLRFGKKECPKCRVPCGTKRSLRRDEAFDKIIQHIYPDPSVFERQQQAMLAKLRENHNANALVQSVEDGLRFQAVNRASRVRTSTSDSKTDDASARANKRAKKKGGSTSATGTGGAQAKEPKDKNRARKLELVFVPHPSEERLPHMDRKYLRTTADCTMAHLAKYLWMNLREMPGHEEDQPNHYEMISFSNAQGYQRVGPRKALGTVLDTVHLHDSEQFTIFYQMRST